MPYAKATRREQEKARSEKRRALGLCKACSDPARPGKTRCQPCATKQR